MASSESMLENTSILCRCTWSMMDLNTICSYALQDKQVSETGLQLNATCLSPFLYIPATLAHPQCPRTVGKLSAVLVQFHLQRPSEIKWEQGLVPSPPWDLVWAGGFWHLLLWHWSYSCWGNGYVQGPGCYWRPLLEKRWCGVRLVPELYFYHVG